MINNYHYFIVLAEELNISRAAQKLFISHQCLSKYLKNLEKTYNTSFFERSPKLSLTPAGKLCLDTLLKIQLLENNLNDQLRDIQTSKTGTIRFGTTEGRYRILIPDLLTDFNELYPHVKLDTYYNTSDQLLESLIKNELDIALMNEQYFNPSQFSVRPILKEQLYMVISDDLLRKHFPFDFEACKETFRHGVDLSKCQDIPFILNHPGFRSRNVLDEYLASCSLQLNCILELTQQDLHFMLAAKNFGACFCWAMYIPSILEQNHCNTGRLNVFPIKGLRKTNQVVLVTPKDRIFPSYGRELIHLVERNCRKSFPL